MTQENPMPERDDMETRLAPPHWYFVYSDFCVLCMKTETERERRYTPRPKKWEDRHELTESACSGHFL